MIEYRQTISGHIIAVIVFIAIAILLRILGAF